MTAILFPYIGVLTEGAHVTREEGMCLMEAVAFVAGEPHSDHPACACTVLSAFGRAWNDGLRTDEERTRLLSPLIQRLVGTRSTRAVEERRAMLALDWHIRVSTPAWLRLVPALVVHADALADLPPITDGATASAARRAVEAAAGAAEAARAAGATGAARAAWAAEAAGAAAAAGAAGATEAAGAARAAVAAWAAWAAVAALEPTVTAMQSSALDLLDRMIKVTA